MYRVLTDMPDLAPSPPFDVVPFYPHNCYLYKKNVLILLMGRLILERFNYA